jgi:hypothetical protein
VHAVRVKFVLARVQASETAEVDHARELAPRAGSLRAPAGCGWEQLQSTRSGSSSRYEADTRSGQAA